MSDKGEEEGFKNLKKWVISFLDAPAVHCALFSIFPIIFQSTHTFTTMCSDSKIRKTGKLETVSQFWSSCANTVMMILLCAG